MTGSLLVKPAQSLGRPHRPCHRRTTLAYSFLALNARSRGDISHTRFGVASALRAKSPARLHWRSAYTTAAKSRRPNPSDLNLALGTAKLQSRASDFTELGQSNARRGVSNALIRLKADASTELDLPDATQLLLCRSWQSAEDRGPKQARGAYWIQPLVVVKDVREHALEF